MRIKIGTSNIHKSVISSLLCSNSDNSKYERYTRRWRCTVIIGVATRILLRSICYQTRFDLLKRAVSAIFDFNKHESLNRFELTVVGTVRLHEFEHPFRQHLLHFFACRRASLVRKVFQSALDRYIIDTSELRDWSGSTLDALVLHSSPLLRETTRSTLRSSIFVLP